MAGRHNPIGLDIGSTSVRAVETTRGREGPSVTRFGAVPLPIGAVQGGVIQDGDAVTAAVRHLWSTARFGTRKVALGVTNPQIVVRQMAVANLPAKELRESLPFQVRDSLPLPVERSLLDFYPTGEGETPETISGLLIAAPKEAVVTAVEAVERAGLHVVLVDLASFALLRAASRLDKRVEAIVDIGAQITSVIVHDDGDPLIVRTVPRGSAEITEKLASALKMDIREAEELKCSTGVVEDAEGTAGSEAAARAAGVIREAVRPLVNEIRSSFAYLSTGDRQTRVTRLLLSGGGALLPGFPEMLAGQLNVATEFADPTLRMRAGRQSALDGFDEFRLSAAVPIGLTLGAH
jgi:type IV pilus assembly protein PilM